MLFYSTLSFWLSLRVTMYSLHLSFKTCHESCLGCYAWSSLWGVASYAWRSMWQGGFRWSFDWWKEIGWVPMEFWSVWVLWRSEFWSAYMEIGFWLRGFRSDGFWSSGFQCFVGIGFWTAWASFRWGSDRVDAEIMGLLVFWFNGFVGLWFNGFFQWACGVVVMIGGLLGFGSSGKFDHFKDRHGLLMV